MTKNTCARPPVKPSSVTLCPHVGYSDADLAWHRAEVIRREQELEAQRRARAVRQPDPSFTLQIGERSYSVEHVPTAATVRLFALTKPDGAVYHVSRSAYGCECTCPDFIWRRDGIDPRGCKHVQALAGAGCLA